MAYTEPAYESLLKYKDNSTVKKEYGYGFESLRVIVGLMD